MAGRANRNNRAPLRVAGHHCAHGGKLRCDLVLGYGVASAAALPFGNFTKLDSQGLGGKSCLAVKLFCLRSERTAGIITKNHLVFLSGFDFLSHLSLFSEKSAVMVKIHQSIHYNNFRVSFQAMFGKKRASSNAKSICCHNLADIHIINETNIFQQ